MWPARARHDARRPRAVGHVETCQISSNRGVRIARTSVALEPMGFLAERNDEEVRVGGFSSSLSLLVCGRRRESGVGGGGS